VQQFYRPGKDIILNPLDTRSPAWNVWADCKDSADFEMIAQALIPEHQSSSDPFWTSAARTIFAALCQQLKKRNKCTMRALLEPIFTDPESADTLATLLKGTTAEALVSEKIDKTALSIKATLSTYCKSLMFLRGLDEDNAQTFSIRDWVNNKDEDSWLFFSVVDNLKMPMLRPLISVWLDVAARSLLTLPLNRDRRIWLYYDELGSAHKLPSLEMVLSEGREYGACNVISLLDKAQLVERYGINSSNTILSLFNTNVLFRTKSEETARWMSGLLGKKEVVERRESVSMGANEIRDGVSLNDERRIEPLVLDTELTLLPNMHAYLVLPGKWARSLIKFQYRKNVGDSKVIEPRDSIDICAIQEEVSGFEVAIKAKILREIEQDKDLSKKNDIELVPDNVTM
jgi:type IV conjugative transfer system coupling protein TraD